MLWLAARGDQPQFNEFFRDPVLTIACVLLVVVSIGWVVIARLIARDIKRAATRRRGRRPAVEAMRRPSDKDIWTMPP